jgi:hypothetical protein
MALVILVIGKFDYVRDDGAIQKVASGSNASLWGALALAAFLVDRRLQRGGTEVVGRESAGSLHSTLVPETVLAT